MNPLRSLSLLAFLALAGAVLAAPPAANSPLRTLRTLRSQVESGRSASSVPGPAALASSNPCPSRSASSAASAVKSFGRLPLAFVENQGQTDRRVRFLSRGRGYTLFLTGTEAVLRVSSPPAQRAPAQRTQRGPSKGDKTVQQQRPAPGHAGTSFRSPSASSATSAVKLRLLNANPRARITGEAPLPRKSNYFVGRDPTRWRTNVFRYAKVRYEQVYPGIDAVYYGNEDGRLEYDFEVSPGADPQQIRLAFSGARRVGLSPNGDLLLRTAAGTLRQRKPVAYQILDGKRVPVTAGYVLTPGPKSEGGKGARARGRTGPEEVPACGSCCPAPLRPCLHLALGPYDRTRPLVIDPVLVYSTFLGGGDTDSGFGVAVDAAGNAYVGGRAESVDYPTTPGTVSQTGPGFFISKIDPTGTSLVYSTYIGAASQLSGIAVDSAGNAVIAGYDNGSGFPTVNAIQPNSAGSTDVVVAKLSPDGSQMVYSTYLGGGSADAAFGVAADSAGNAYVVGRTHSSNFPTANPLQAARLGTNDGFVAKLNAAGTALVYSTYMGGNEVGGDQGAFGGVAADAAGNAYLAGSTNAPDFPTTPGAFDRTINGGSDAVVAKLNSTGSSLLFSTFVGGSGSDGARDVAVGLTGDVYVGSTSFSADHPTTPGAYDTSFTGAYDGVVTRLNSAGSALVYSTFLGGGGADAVGPIAVDAVGNAHVGGGTGSADFPTVDPVQAALAGDSDGTVTTLNSTGSALLFSTYLGGSMVTPGFASDVLEDLAIDTGGNIYVTGYTASPDFPTVNPIQPDLIGQSDAFLAKIGSNVPPPSPPAAPTNLSAAAVSQTRIDLTWGDNSDNEAGFRVERWNGSLYIAIATLGANATSYSNTGLLAATTYRYRVIAFNAGGDSPPSNTAEATTLPNPPSAPSNLVATALSQTEIRLTWNENATNEDGLEVWRSTGGPFALHAGLGPNQTSYLDQNLTAATLYVYQVRAVNAGGNSAFSNQAGATTLPNPPAAPSGLTATAVSGSQINLAWGDNATNETEFVLEVSSDGGTTFALLATRGADTTSYSHTGLSPETTRHYRVKARNAGGDSAWSNVAFATTPQVPPAAPTNLNATALSSSEIRLNWNDVSGEQGYRIERRQGNDPFAVVTNVAANVTTYTDGGLQPNKVYVYRVLAFNQAGNSDWSNEASARTLRSRPSPPHSLTSAAISATQVDLAWSDENEDEQGFILERSENAGVSWSQVASLPANVTRASDTSAQGGKSYQYRLKAWNDVGQSDPSNVASVSTPAAVVLASLTVTPASVRGRRNATGKVTLSGAAPSGGVSVTLASSNVAAVVPSSVTVAAGATEATFSVTTARVRRNTRVTLTATLGAVQKTATVTVKK